MFEFEKKIQKYLSDIQDDIDIRFESLKADVNLLKESYNQVLKKIKDNMSE